MQRIPLRDKHGYILPKLSKKEPTLVWCPEKECLLHMGHCEACELFVMMAENEIICNTNKPFNSGAYYDGRTTN